MYNFNYYLLCVINRPQLTASSPLEEQKNDDLKEVPSVANACYGVLDISDPPPTSNFPYQSV